MVIGPYAGERPEFRLVFPDIPPPHVWATYLEPAIRRNWYSNFGPVVRKFEHELKVRFGGDETACVCVSSATSGIAACLIAHNVTGNVICPSFTFPATISAILMARCSPLIVDIDPTTLCIDLQLLERVLASRKVEAVVLVIPYGLHVDIDHHIDLCRKNGVRLIIDNASGLGTPRTPVEKIPTVDEVFSLHATKPFSVGEGGVIFSNHANRERLESAINFGLSTHTRTGQKGEPHWGINGKLSEVHAAIGLAVSDNIEERVLRRQAAADKWFNELSNYPDVLLAKRISDGPWQVFPLVMPDFNAAARFINNAEKADVELRRYYFPSLGNCGGLEQYAESPCSDDISGRVVALPIRPDLSPADQNVLVKRVTSALSRALVG